MISDRGAETMTALPKKFHLFPVLCIVALILAAGAVFFFFGAKLIALLDSPKALGSHIVTCSPGNGAACTMADLASPSMDSPVYANLGAYVHKDGTPGRAQFEHVSLQGND
jgi:hypothetical protein